MHKRSRNEHGYTLIYALLSIVLIFIFATVLVTANLNSSKQINISENKVQTTHLAEMGLQFFNEALKYTLSQPLSEEERKSIKTIEDAKNNLVVRLNSNLENMGVTLTSEDNSFYEFRIDLPNNLNTYYKVTYKFFVTADSSGSTVIRLIYKLTSGNPSIAETQPYQQEDKDFLWTAGGGISLPGSTIPKPVAGSPEECGGSPCDVYANGSISIPMKAEMEVLNFYSEGSITLNNFSALVTGGNFYVKGILTLDNFSYINVSGGSAYFNDIDSKPNAKTIVKGDAYFYGNDDGKLIGNGNSAFMCIQGTAYLEQNSNIKPDHINDLKGADCEASGLKSGIWADEVESFTGTFPERPDWTYSQPGTGGDMILDPVYN